MRNLHCRLALLWVTLILNPWTAWAADTAPVELPRAEPALISFVQSVVDTNPRVQAAQFALNARGSLRDAASRPLYNPQLNLDVENADVDTRALGISQTLDWAGKRAARTSVAEADREVAEAEYLSARWAATIELLDGLAQHQTGVERNELADARRRLMQEFSELAQRRFDAGDLNQVEISLANLAATQARIQKATAGARLAEARQAVRNIVPRSPADQWPLLPNAMPSLPSNGSDPDALVLALPNVVAVRRQVASAEAVVDLRRRERRPDPTVSLAGGEVDGETLVGLNFSIPLFVRNRFSAEVSAAMAQRSRAQQIQSDVMQRAHARLISAAERYELSRGAWNDWTLTGQTSLTSQTEQLKKLWEAGELSTTEYLVQLQQTLDVQASALDLREALWRAWFEWLWASGQVDAWLGQGAAR